MHFGGETFPLSDFSLHFPAHPAWVGVAREAMRTALAHGLPAWREIMETAVLLTSEVVSNAVIASRACRHPYPPVDLYASWTLRGDLHVRVFDRAPGEPVTVPPPSPSPDDEHGRGLLLLAQLARRWNVHRHNPAPGKTVWFQL
ncbi:ATP-binding protein [Streptomyces aidingensis]|uniref:ATP-binding protein n=1 Tax=Streptomyces aidingensis TaxID=910347 RepID=UPI001FE3D843|nr:ATP-binding protein [Streptomyces aidingensis]